MKIIHELKRIEMLRKAYRRANAHSDRVDWEGNKYLADVYQDLAEILEEKVRLIEAQIRNYARPTTGHTSAFRRKSRVNQVLLAQRYTGVKVI